MKKGIKTIDRIAETIGMSIGVHNCKKGGIE